MLRLTKAMKNRLRSIPKRNKLITTKKRMAHLANYQCSLIQHLEISQIPILRAEGIRIHRRVAVTDLDLFRIPLSIRILRKIAIRRGPSQASTRMKKTQTY